MASKTILIKGGTLVTMNRERRIIKDGAILVEDGRITSIGKADEFGGEKADRVIDASGKYIFPGFINCHTHMFQVLLRDVAMDMVLLDWLKTSIWPSIRHLREEDIYIAAKLGIVENIRSGVTCIVDNQYPRNYEPSIRAMHESGIRGVLACGYYEINVPEDLRMDADKALKMCEEMIRRWHGRDEGRLRVCPAPMHPCFASKELLLKSKELADKYQTYLHVHTAESVKDVELLKQMTGKTDVEYLHELGILDERFHAVHAVQVSPEEMRLFASAHANIIHNPISNAYTGAGVAPIPEYLRLGCNVALGTDGPASGGNHDFLQSMKFTALIHKGFRRDPTVMRVSEILEMATINGAKALGMEGEIGSLEAGKRADLIILDLHKPHTVYVHDPIANLVYAATSENIETVIVDGEILMEDRRITYIDEEEVMAEASKVAERLMEKFSRRG